MFCYFPGDNAKAEESKASGLRCGSAVERLPSLHEALGSVPSRGWEGQNGEAAGTVPEQIANPP